ncbi:MAG: ribosome biogenesis GTPase Der [Candidatus Electryonea clarkiae]|nr:ribosome biogenesis GTPase Der [Candidatus Electryonea clarkiae]MDP8286452.1 ribosome biogenesis GTPase Der [Candidatus Electryonea clarkiae]
MSKPIVAIVGRPNVGKSTLFNRLIKRRVAIEDDQSGVTRDRISQDMEWNGYKFTLVDTGGLVGRAAKDIEKLVSKAAEVAILEADKLIVVVDGQVGSLEGDMQVARLAQRSGLSTVLAVTKIDTPQHETAALDFYNLGLGEPVPVSGISGMNTGDLLDFVVEDLPESLDPETDADEVRLALIGRPNVGKSSLLNRLIGSERQIVSEKPGTTRDAVDHLMRYQGKSIRLIDTAGLKRSRELYKESLEYYTALRTIRAINRSDVAAVLIDAADGLTQYDRRLLDDVRNKGKGLIAVINKWDLIEKDSRTLIEFEKELRLQLPDLSFVPVVFISALTGQRARNVLDTAMKVHEQRGNRISTANLNQFIQRIIEYKPPPSVKGKWLKIKYTSQVATNPPRFAVFMNYANLMPEAYKRFLERCIREEFGFEGVPIRVTFRKK